MAILFLGGFIACLAASSVSGLHKEDKSAPAVIGDLIDLQGLRQEGPDWRVSFQDLSQDKGHLKLSQSLWLMYFLHWRPLAEIKRILSVENVRNLMLNFWGQVMNFKLLNIDGETEICGHKAFFSEGTVMDGAVHTRFIVWNCPETDRQFIADCNINLRRKTPKDLLDLQRTITGTICCHKGASPPDVPAALAQKYLSEKWNVSFFIPPNWRTADYVAKDWYPRGMSAQNGSLWTLPTDSMKRLELVWENDEGALYGDVFNRFMKKCASPFTFENITSKIVEWKLTDVKEKGGVWAGEGFFEYHQKTQNQEAVSPYRFKAFIWKEGKTVFFLLASLVQLEEFWNIPNDLSPSNETFERFVGVQLLPNIKIVPLAAYSAAKNYPQPLSEDPLNYLKETSHLDYSQPIFQDIMDKILAPGMTLEKKLERLFYYVRDGLPFASSASLTASGALKAGYALCYTKAMVLVSFCRRLGVPAKLAAEHFTIKADSKPRLHRHGIAKIFFHGKWIYVDTVSNRDSWNHWGIDASVPFDPPEFSLDHDVVAGSKYYDGPTFEDYWTDDVPDYWLRDMREYLDRARWPSYQFRRSQESSLKVMLRAPPFSPQD